MKYLLSLQSEWLKTKRSSAFWLCFAGAGFIPALHLLRFLISHTSLNDINKVANVWEGFFVQLCNPMVLFILPMSIILIVSLLAQIEYKNNAWKQVFSSPQTITTIFTAKFTIVILLVLTFFIVFNIGMLISGFIPCLLFEHHLPQDTIPWLYLVKKSVNFFIFSLPIAALQNITSLKFRQVMVPIGSGFLWMIGTLFAIKWKYIIISPFSYNLLTMMPIKSNFNIYLCSLSSFSILICISYVAFLKNTKRL